MVSPPNGVTWVAVNAKIQVLVSAPVSAVSVTGSAIQVTSGSGSVAGTLSVGSTVLTFTPSSPLAVSTTYTVTVGGFTDLAGNAVQAFTSSFTTGSSAVADTTPPTVTAVNPANGATGVAVTSTVVVTFSKTVNPLTVATGTVR